MSSSTTVAYVVTSVVTLVAAYVATLDQEKIYAGRMYLTRKALLHPKKDETAWRRLHDHGEDKEYLACLRFDKKTFAYILSYFQPFFDMATLHDDSNHTGRGSNRILSVCTL